MDDDSQDNRSCWHEIKLDLSKDDSIMGLKVFFIIFFTIENPTGDPSRDE